MTFSSVTAARPGCATNWWWRCSSLSGISFSGQSSVRPPDWSLTPICRYDYQDAVQLLMKLPSNLSVSFLAQHARHLKVDTAACLLSPYSNVLPPGPAEVPPPERLGLLLRPARPGPVLCTVYCARSGPVLCTGVHCYLYSVLVHTATSTVMLRRAAPHRRKVPLQQAGQERQDGISRDFHVVCRVYSSVEEVLHWCVEVEGREVAASSSLAGVVTRYSQDCPADLLQLSSGWRDCWPENQT